MVTRDVKPCVTSDIYGVPTFSYPIYIPPAMIVNVKRVMFSLVVVVIVVSCVLILNYNSNGIRRKRSIIVPHALPPRHIKGKRLAFHHVYEPRKIYFGNYKINDVIDQGNSNPKIILMATPWNGVWNTINYYSLQFDKEYFKRLGCPNTNCRVTKHQKHIDKADAVVYHLLDLPKSFPKSRNPNQIWIAYNLEAPWRLYAHKVNISKLNGIFNWTMSYREDSDVPVKYGLIGNNTAADRVINEKRYKLPFEQKKSVVWFVSDCNVPSNRENYVRQLKKYITIDIFGACGTKRCFPSQSSVCYEDILKKYKFYLSFENSICKDYVTEKYFNVLEYDVVPVVFGGADYQSIGPPGGFLDATKYPNPRELGKLLNEISNDEAKYNKYLEWKSSYRSYLYPWMCYLCDKLHRPIVPSVKYDFKKWFIKDSQCQTWDSKQNKFVLV